MKLNLSHAFSSAILMRTSSLNLIYAQKTFVGPPMIHISCSFILSNFIVLMSFNTYESKNHGTFSPMIGIFGET